MPTSVKFTGDAADLKKALDEVNLKLKQTKLAAQEIKVQASQQSDIRDFFRNMRGGAETAAGSLRGMGMAFSAAGSMMPIVAAGVLFEALKKMGVFKGMFEGITDALGFTTIAADKLAETEKIAREANISGLNNEIILLRAKGSSLDDIHQKELDKAKAEFENIKATMLAYTLSEKNFDKAKKGGELDQKLQAAKTAYFAIEANWTKKNYETGIDYINQTRLLKEKGLQKDLDEIEIWYNKTLEETPSADQYALFLFYEAKKKAAIDKSLEEQKKNDGESLKYISFYYDTIQKQVLKLVEIDTGHSEKTVSNLKDMTRITHELAGAFDTLFSGGKNGWKDLENYMVSFFEKMITEVIAAIAVWGVLDIVSGGLGTGVGTLGHFIGKVLGYAGGTNYAPGGLAIVGEHGPELVNLPRGSQVIPNNQLSGGELTCRVSGGDLLFVLNTQSRKMNSYR